MVEAQVSIVIAWLQKIYSTYIYQTLIDELSCLNVIFELPSVLVPSPSYGLEEDGERHCPQLLFAVYKIDKM